MKPQIHLLIFLLAGLVSCGPSASSDEGTWIEYQSYKGSFLQIKITNNGKASITKEDPGADSDSSDLIVPTRTTNFDISKKEINDLNQIISEDMFEIYEKDSDDTSVDFIYLYLRDKDTGSYLELYFDDLGDLSDESEKLVSTIVDISKSK